MDYSYETANDRELAEMYTLALEDRADAQQQVRLVRAELKRRNMNVSR